MAKKPINTDAVIKKLTPFQHLRHRTEMYFGSRVAHTQPVLNWTGDQLELTEQTWIPAVYVAFRELLDNALDEQIAHAKHSRGTRIDVEYNEKKRSFSVSDDGRGIPIDWDPQEKMHKATLALANIMAGRNFEERSDTAGVNGIGASGVNFCSEWFTVEIHRDQQKFVQEFSDAGGNFDHLQISDPQITPYNGTKTGTRVSCKLSPIVFKNFILPESFVRARVFEIAANHPNIKFSFNGQKISVKPTLARTLFSKNQHFLLDIQDEGFSSQYYIVTDFAGEGETVHSTVNDIPTFNGGQHIDVFRRLFYSGLLKSLERESKKRKLTPNRNDVSEGLLIYNVTRMRSPNFDSQSKTRLINEEVETHIKKYFDDGDVFSKIIKSNREWIDQIYARCAARTSQKDSNDIEKANRKLMRTKVPSLMDATGRDRTQCILFLSEGQSACASLAAVRTPEIHGSLPLRGKIINAHGESPRTLQDNQVVSNIMSAIGLGIGRPADRSNLRYGQVYLAADQDPDGANITALLVNFFWLNWPELFDPKLPAFFSVFMTPFIIQQRGRDRYYWYNHNVHEYQASDWRGCPPPTRAKGLGSLEEIDWVHSLAKPCLVPLVDDGKMKESLDLIFNHKLADQRKAWISLHE